MAVGIALFTECNSDKKWSSVFKIVLVVSNQTSILRSRPDFFLLMMLDDDIIESSH